MKNHNFNNTNLIKANYFFRTLCLPILLLYCLFANAQDTIISQGQDWFYYDLEKPLPNTWYLNKDIDASWKKGASPLGYNDELVKTTISYGNDKNKKHITKYFVKKFIIDDPYSHLIYKINFQRDDGIVIYLNGKEIERNNMPDGVITNSTRANALVFSSKNAKIKYTKLVSPNDLLDGENIISASVHQARSTSSDCVFNLELIGSNDSETIPMLLKEHTIDNLKLNLKLNELNHNQESENLKSRINDLSWTKNIFGTIIFLSFIVFSVLCVWLYLKQKKLNTEIKALIENVTQLKEINKTKDREIMNLSLKALNDKQFMKGIKSDIEDYLQTNTNSRALKQIATKIDHSLDFEDEWVNLKKHFNEVHLGYVDNLIAKYPSLTDIELRHCIFMKLHMQTKEIANILNIDPRSVQAARYRLKKKMNLDEDTDLKTFLQSIS